MIIEKDMKGLVFLNKNATTERHPKWKGNAQVNGVQYHLSIWEGVTENGNKKMNITFQTEDEAAAWQNQDPDPEQTYDSVKEVQESVGLAEDELPF